MCICENSADVFPRRHGSPGDQFILTLSSPAFAPKKDKSILGHIESYKKPDHFPTQSAVAHQHAQ